MEYSSIVWLTQGKYAIIDNEEADNINARKWHYVKHGKGYAYHRLSKGSLLMHRVILDTPMGLLTDHINGNSLDNRKANLRTCNSLNNAHNISVVRSKSRFKGVSETPYKTFRAKIEFKGSSIGLGTFNNAIKAAQVYDEAALKYHGEFAKTNKMLGLL